ncbi:MAG TPA: ABC transporter substrate-binding protein [Stellaceae bacterium]|jgi:ABC-type nitrate/sulfonate/bicarbonate transport system substrate-binding protein|nr:ABC transporter substrate-binding protein [Stellaceae bacterium]
MIVTPSKKNFRGVAAVGALALLSLAAPAQSAELEKTVIAQTPAIMSFLAAYIAEDAGIWRDNGLDVKVINLPGNATVNAVISNNADFALTASDALTRAAAHGQRLLAIAALNNMSGQVTVIRKDIAEAAHFDPKAPLAERARVMKGHTMAGGNVGSVADVFLKVIAREAGIKPDEMTVAAIGAFDQLAAFDRKAVDGISFSLPYPQQLVANGSAVVVVDGTNNEPQDLMPLAAGLVLTRPQLCVDHRSVCEKMGRSIAQAAKYLRERKANALAILQKRFPKTDASVTESAYEAVARMTNDPPAITLKAVENGDLMNDKAGLLKPEDRVSSYDGLFTNEYLK